MNKYRRKLNKDDLLPPGWTWEKLGKKDSIIWNDSKSDSDLLLIAYLIEMIVTNDPKRLVKYTHKIFQNIQKKSWQRKYSSRAFIFLVHDKLRGKDIKLNEDIKAMLSFQAIEIIYFLRNKECKEPDQFKDIGFDCKVSDIYSAVYGKRVNSDTADVLRIIRNNIAHAGIVEGLPHTTYKKSDQEKIDNFLGRFNRNRQDLYGLTSVFNDLVDNMVLRIMGLEDDDFMFTTGWPNQDPYFK